MTDDEVSDLINKEFGSPTLGTTESYLEIHQPVYENGLIKIDRVDRDGFDDTIIIAYLPVRDEYFSLAVYIDTIRKEIFNVGTESRNTVCLRATSEKLTSDQMISLVNFAATRSWNKGDLSKIGKMQYTYSFFEYEPNPEPDTVQDKLRKLLTALTKEKSGLLALTKQTEVYIQVFMDFHGGNQLLGSSALNLSSIKSLAELNLEIKFDFAVWGTPFN